MCSISGVAAADGDLACPVSVTCSEIFSLTAYIFNLSFRADCVPVVHFTFAVLKVCYASLLCAELKTAVNNVLMANADVVTKIAALKTKINTITTDVSLRTIHMLATQAAI